MAAAAAIKYQIACLLLVGAIDTAAPSNNSKSIMLLTYQVAVKY